MAKPQTGPGHCKVLIVVDTLTPLLTEGPVIDMAGFCQGLNNHVHSIFFHDKTLPAIQIDKEDVVTASHTIPLRFTLLTTLWKIYKTAKQEGITHLLFDNKRYGMTALFCRWLLGTKTVLLLRQIDYHQNRIGGRWRWPAVWLYEGLVMRSSHRVLLMSLTDYRRAGDAWAPWPLRFPQLDLLPVGPVNDGRIDGALVGRIAAQKIRLT